MESIKSSFYTSKSKLLFNQLWLPNTDDFSQLTSATLRGFSCKNNISSRAYISSKFKMHKKLSSKLNKKIIIHNANNNNMIASRKIRIFPNHQYIDKFNISIGANRYIYNKTVSIMNETYRKSKAKFDLLAKKGCIFFDKNKKQCCKSINDKYFCIKHKKSKLDYGLSLSLKHWRDIVMCKNANLPEHEKWLIGATYDSRQLSIKNLLTNIKSAITNLKNGNIKHFKIDFRSKKARNQFFFLDSRELRNDGVLWPKYFNNPLKMRRETMV